MPLWQMKCRNYAINHSCPFDIFCCPNTNDHTFEIWKPIWNCMSIFFWMVTKLYQSVTGVYLLRRWCLLYLEAWRISSTNAKDPDTNKLMNKRIESGKETLKMLTEEKNMPRKRLASSSSVLCSRSEVNSLNWDGKKKRGVTIKRNLLELKVMKY